MNWKPGEDVIIAGLVSDDDDAKKTYPQGWKAPKPYLRIVPQPHRFVVVYGRPPLGKGIFGVSASGSGAVMYPAFVRGAWTAGPDGVRRSGSNHSGAL